MSKMRREVMAEGNEYTIVSGYALGADGADMTTQRGVGWAITRTGEGAYNLTFTEAYDSLVSIVFGLQAATPADLKGYTVVADTLSSKVIPFVVYNASDTAADLVANQYLHFTAIFQRTGVTT